MHGLVPYLYIAPAFAVTIVFSFVSMGISFWASLHHYDAFAGAAEYAGLDNYRRALFADDSYFWLSLKNTAVYSAMSVVGVLLTALPLAILCQKARRFQALFRTLYFLPSITPGVVLALVFYHLFGVWGQLLDNAWTSLPALALLGVWSGAGYNMVIFLAGLTEIPKDFYEAAEIDGAGRWHQFRHITVPLLRNTLVFVMVMTIISSFQVFTSVYIMTQGGPERSTEVIAYTIFINAFAVAGQMGYASALAWLLFAVVFVFVFIQMRVFRSRRIYDE
ncbi:MAG: sugar ABC transporter permease [Gemmatimonadetes bacterium]|jgi:multiple sugar transport system permease protein|nr:sugar ABC transporter permease [Gemmatimonadota bacterium]MDE0965033.1 sugar ABC transporter permease [Candidatus Latescibacterota bacterium]MBT5324789.1 sugar ABC transporter permease [Gemmatimonadota bacterium]MBT5448761.1 sugar ABC transporter permease [Gemmatimonadota bacterium]MBT5803733.1 sugar ABC transporter permease [Gemmatimonadota bacterium]|tara:strand:- start:33 stop:863 length:831 start_codon:yes stop_codon:yes gene_type:complete